MHDEALQEFNAALNQKPKKKTGREAEADATQGEAPASEASDYKPKRPVLPRLASDEGSLPAFGVGASQNGNRRLALYDEGEGLFKALENGDGGAFNRATMTKLHNGGEWSRVWRLA